MPSFLRTRRVDDGNNLTRSQGYRHFCLHVRESGHSPAGEQPVVEGAGEFESVDNRRLGTHFLRLDEARANTRAEVAVGGQQLHEMRNRYLVEAADLEPQVFVHLTDNWIELSVRFLVSTHGIRAVKDQISRQVLSAFQTAGIDIASQTVELVRPRDGSPA